MNTFLFVYGTLKKDQLSHQVIASLGAEFIDEVEVMNVAMYRTRASFFPIAVPSEGDSIFGEVYKIKTEHMSKIDTLEGFNRTEPAKSLFIRDVCSVGNVVLGGRAWIYLLNPLRKKEIPSDAIKIQRW